VLAIPNRKGLVLQERVIEDPVLAQRYIFRDAVAEDGVDVLQLETWVQPGGGVLIPHVHPQMEERFKMLEGQVSFLVGRKWIAKGAGEEAVVARGVRHAYRNTGREVAHFMCETRPRSQELQQFLEDAAGLNRAGKLTKRGVPKSLSGLLAGAVMLQHYREMVVFTFPPPFLQRAVMGPLARVGERRGYRAGSFG